MDAISMVYKEVSKDLAKSVAMLGKDLGIEGPSPKIAALGLAFLAKEFDSNELYNREASGHNNKTIEDISNNITKELTECVRKEYLKYEGA